MNSTDKIDIIKILSDIELEIELNKNDIKTVESYIDDGDHLEILPLTNVIFMRCMKLNVLMKTLKNYMES